MIKGKNKFSIGERIELIRIKSKYQKIYPSQVLDIINDKIFVASGPIYRNEIVVLSKDEIIEISYIIENKGKYSFKAKVLKIEYENIYKLELEKISDIERFQLRGFYRFDIDIPVIKEFVIEGDNRKETVTEKCRTKNISGGGLKLYSNYNHAVGDIVLCRLNIDNHQIVAKGKIVRIEKIDTFDYAYGLGIKFMKLNEKDRDKIIQFIFSKQRLLREKGLI